MTKTQIEAKGKPLNFKEVKELIKSIPYSCQIIVIELTDDAIPLQEFNHPKRCIYLLGAEDNGLSTRAFNLCQHIIRLHGKISLNVAVAGSIVLYDRVAKNKIISYEK